MDMNPNPALWHFLPPGTIKMRWLSEYFHRNYPEPGSLLN